VVTFGGVLILMFLLHLILHHGDTRAPLKEQAHRNMKFNCEYVSKMSIEA
jgi:hypothetical protein